MAAAVSCTMAVLSKLRSPVTKIYDSLRATCFKIYIQENEKNWVKTIPTKAMALIPTTTTRPSLQTLGTPSLDLFTSSMLTTNIINHSLMYFNKKTDENNKFLAHWQDIWPWRVKQDMLPHCLLVCWCRLRSWIRRLQCCSWTLQCYCKMIIRC